MALLFTESFDWASSLADLQQKWTYVLNVGTTASGRTGKAGAGTGANAQMHITCLGGVSTVIVGMAVKFTAVDPVAFLVLGSASAWECGLAINADGTFQPFVVSSGNHYPGSQYYCPRIGVPSVVVRKVNVWHYVEVKIVCDGSVGRCTFRLDGVEVFDQQNLDTLYTSAVLTRVGIGHDGGALVFDDIVVMDTTGSQCNDFVGDVRVVGLLPQTDAVGGAGSNADFTPSTGTDHGALVDEVGPNGDTDYLQSNTLNHVDTWNFPALGYTGVIKAVALNLSAKKVDAGTRAIAAVTRPASTNRVHGTNQYLSTSYANKQFIWELNPEDSAAWEVADVDGAQFGLKVTV